MIRNFTSTLTKTALISALFLLTSLVSFAQLVGGTIYPINGTDNGTTSFATLRSAVAYLTANGVTGTGKVVLEFAAPYINEDMTTGITIGAFASPTSATLGVTIRPGVGINVDLNSPMATDYLVTMDNCNYITIDGRQGGIGAIGLTITSTASRPTVFFGNGTENSIKYTNLKSDVTDATLGNIYISLSGTNGTIANNNISANDPNGGSANGVCNLSTNTENFKILNNNITGFTARGILLSAGTGAGWLVSGNSIYNTKAPTATDPYGILVAVPTPNMIINDNFIGGNGPLCTGMMPVTTIFNAITFITTLTTASGTYSVKGNTIANIESTTAKGVRGIYIKNPDVASTYNIESNKIYNFKNLGVAKGTAIVGIHLESAGNSVANFNLTNNIISFNAANSGSENMYGFYRTGGVNTITNAYFNTIHMGGTSTATNLANFYIHTNTTTSIHNIKNNVFSNSYLNGVSYTPTPGAGGTLVSSANIIVYDGASTKTDQTFKYGDAGKPASPTDFFHDVVGGVLLVNPTYYSEVFEKAELGTGVTTDIMARSRSLTKPTSGAYENNATVLPVTIRSFTATLNNNKVVLKWEVGTESNVNGYEIERSEKDGVFAKVAAVSASGANSYSAVDNSPLAGDNYYRLKTVDNDGTSSYYGEIRVVKMATLTASSFAIYPNPIVNDEINVALKNYTNGAYSYQVVDMAGRLLQQGKFNHDGAAKHTISLNGAVGKGAYILYLTNGKEVMQTKFIKN